MDGSKLKMAILIVSNTAHNDPSTDKSGSTLRDVIILEGGDKWEVLDTKIVPDEVTQIQRQIMLWTDSADVMNLIVTTGGTGFAKSDSTPEVILCISMVFYSPSMSNG
jgi:gephyrin